MSMLETGLSPELVWGLLTRGIGCVYLISFLSISAQIVPAAGVHSVNPIGEMLTSVRRDFSWWQRIAYFPTLLWFNTSDLSLRLLTWFGAACAACVVYGGPLSQLAMLGCYVTYVSLDKPMGLVFPWDCVLFEAGFLGAFLLPTLDYFGVVAAVLLAITSLVASGYAVQYGLSRHVNRFCSTLLEARRKR